jgi:predicted DCC family thiol-disulfide oxidoreductase YuxK
MFPWSITTRVRDIFGADLRSLALLRIAVGILLLVDLAQRASDLVAHYTDFGVLPRTAAIETAYSRWLLSIHFINGTWEIQAILFSLAGLFALALLVGYQTRIATIGSWFLFLSLNIRNPIILQGGDIEFRVILFWAIFLPWGMRYSIDKVLHPEWDNLPTATVSWATFAYLFQIIFIYWFGALLKTGPEWRSEWTAVYYALSIDHFTTPLGDFLLQFPWLLKVLTVAVFWFEALGPFLLLSPIYTGPLRTLGVLGFFLMHLGFGLGLAIGLFAFIGALCPIGLLPSWFWEKIANRLDALKSRGLKIYYDRDCGFCANAVRVIRGIVSRDSQILTAQSDPSIDEEMRKKNSWVVVDESGKRYFEYQAALMMVTQSPLLRPLVWFLNLSLVKKLGERVYRSIANHRRVACRIPESPGASDTQPLRMNIITSSVLMTLLLWVLVWNVANLPAANLTVPERIGAIGRLLGLDQQWGMFAPYPHKGDGWYVIPARLKDGQIIDLFRGGRPVTWEKPSRVAATYKNYRWRKYMMNLWLKDYERHRPYYAQYLCRDWNSRHRGAQRLEELEIVYMLEVTLPDYEYFTPEKVLLLKHRCADAKGG